MRAFSGIILLKALFLNMNNNSILINKVYKLKEVADLLCVDESTIYREQAKGRLPKRMVGKGFKFLGQDLIKFMELTVNAEQLN